MAVRAARMLGRARLARGSRGEAVEAGRVQSGSQNMKDCSNETKHPFPKHTQILELKFNLNSTEANDNQGGKATKAQKRPRPAPNLVLDVFSPARS